MPPEDNNQNMRERDQRISQEGQRELERARGQILPSAREAMEKMTSEPVLEEPKSRIQEEPQEVEPGVWEGVFTEVPGSGYTQEEKPDDIVIDTKEPELVGGIGGGADPINWQRTYPNPEDFIRDFERASHNMDEKEVNIYLGPLNGRFSSDVKNDVREILESRRGELRDGEESPEPEAAEVRDSTPDAKTAEESMNSNEMPFSTVTRILENPDRYLPQGIDRDAAIAALEARREALIRDGVRGGQSGEVGDHYRNLRRLERMQVEGTLTAADIAELRVDWGDFDEFGEIAEGENEYRGLQQHLAEQIRQRIADLAPAQPIAEAQAAPEAEVVPETLQNISFRDLQRRLINTDPGADGYEELEEERARRIALAEERGYFDVTQRIVLGVYETNTFEDLPDALRREAGNIDRLVQDDAATQYEDEGPELAGIIRAAVNGVATRVEYERYVGMTPAERDAIGMDDARFAALRDREATESFWNAGIRRDVIGTRVQQVAGGATAEAYAEGIRTVRDEREFNIDEQRRQFLRMERWTGTTQDDYTEKDAPAWFVELSRRDPEAAECVKVRMELIRAANYKREKVTGLADLGDNKDLNGINKADMTLLYTMDGVREALQIYAQEAMNPNSDLWITVGDRNTAEVFRRNVEGRVRQALIPLGYDDDKLRLAAWEAEQVAFNLMYVANTFESLDSKWETDPRHPGRYVRTKRPTQNSDSLVSGGLKGGMNPMDNIIGRITRQEEKMKPAGQLTGWARTQGREALDRIGANNFDEVVVCPVEEAQSRWWTAERYNDGGQQKVRLYIPDFYPVNHFESAFEYTKINNRSIMDYLVAEEEVPWDSPDADGMWGKYGAGANAAGVLTDYINGGKDRTMTMGDLNPRVGAETIISRWSADWLKNSGELGRRNDKRALRWALYNAFGVKENERLPMLDTIQTRKKVIIVRTMSDKGLGMLDNGQELFTWDRPDGMAFMVM